VQQEAEEGNGGWLKSRTIKLDEAKVAAIRKRLAQGEQSRALAREFGVARHTIHDIKYRVTWKHV
jgi:DNA invertase Pin-like site-specific DNA recombinase